MLLLAVNSILLPAGILNCAAITLGEGLDKTNLVWTTGGDAPWHATNAAATPTLDGTDAAATGVVLDNEASWLETTVTGPGVLSFWWSVSSEPDFDQLVFYVNGDIFGEPISGEGGWQYRTVTLTNGSHTLKWEFSRDDVYGEGENQAYLDQVKFVTNTPPSLAEALNTPAVVWTTGGNENPTWWAGQTNVSRVDGKAAESGAVTTWQDSWMQTTVSGVTNVSFWWKVSSVTNHGFLRFYVDSFQTFQVSGDVGWQFKSVAITTNEHVLRWIINTDDLAIGGLNTGWVDEVGFLPSLTASMTLSSPVRLPDGRFQFNLNFESGRFCQVEYCTNLATPHWSLLLSTNTTAASTLITDSSASNSVPRRYYRVIAP